MVHSLLLSIFTEQLSWQGRVCAALQDMDLHLSRNDTAWTTCNDEGRNHGLQSVQSSTRLCDILTHSPTDWHTHTNWFLPCDCEAYARSCYRRLSVRLSVCPSVRLSVKRVHCDKTKAPSEKSSLMTNRTSPTSFPMSLRRTSYVAPNPPKGASKAQIWPIICNNFETVRDRM